LYIFIHSIIYSNLSLLYFKNSLSFIFLLLLVQLSCKSGQLTTDQKIEQKTIEDSLDYALAKNETLKKIDFDALEAEDVFRYANKVYKKDVKSVQLYRQGDALSFPVLFLSEQNKLELHFDELNGSLTNYNYDIIHCNANWEPSRLNRQEYLDGFFNGFIEEYKYSFNTRIPFLHYSLDFPNQEIQFKKSGNYIIRVYDNNTPEDLILTRRFYVVQKRVDIESNIHIATLARHMDYKQEIDFDIVLNNYQVQDPYSEIKVTIQKNRRHDNAITDIKPLFISSERLSYDYEQENLFDGGNEYRFFDAKDFRYQALNVDGIQLINGKTHLFVLAGEPRSYKRYFMQNDLNGLRLIKRNESRDINREANYMVTHFKLNRESPLPNGDLYVFGELSDWQFTDEFKMKYDESSSSYQLQVLLKQGYYNYQYVFLPKGSEIGDEAMIEGTHAEAENDYYFFVYHRKIGEIYDRLIGFDVKNSNNPQD